MRKELRRLVMDAPDTPGAFEGSAQPLPLAQALFGPQPPRALEMAGRLKAKDEREIAESAEEILALAEYTESVEDDRKGFFLSDAALRGCVLTGTTWRRGWLLLAGEGADGAAAHALEKAGFLVFRTGSRLDAAKFNLGARETSGVYFGQMMARYATIYGRVRPGDAAAMRTFLATDVPAAIVVVGTLRPIEGLVIFALMALGAPAVVPASFPFPVERKTAAGSIAEVLQRLDEFPNLRVKSEADRGVRLPAGPDSVNTQEILGGDFDVIGGDESFLQARVVEPGKIEAPQVETKGESVTECPSNGGLKVFGVLIEVAEPGVEIADTAQLETAVRNAINLLGGVKLADLPKGIPEWRAALRVVRGQKVDAKRLAQGIADGLKFSFPRMARVRVSVLGDADAVKAETPRVIEYAARRREALDRETSDARCPAVACVECQVFAPEHVCVVLPERPPACGSRNYCQAKLAALFGPDWRPYRRRADADRPVQSLIERGECLDAERGEWSGINEAVARLSGGRVTRCFLHSLRDFPHPSGGGFRLLAFWIGEVGGIGVMHRGFRGTAPDGRTWDTLANEADGKQCAGLMAVSPEYFRSPHFLRGDGGRRNLVWASRQALDLVKDLLPAEQKVATEKDASTIEALKAFLGR